MLKKIVLVTVMLVALVMILGSSIALAAGAAPAASPVTVSDLKWSNAGPLDGLL